MSDHLPECLWPDSKYHECICDRLRACEARVRYSNALSNAAAKREALDAARDAVAAIENWLSYDSNGDGHMVFVSDPRAAIDALKGE